MKTIPCRLVLFLLSALVVHGCTSTDLKGLAKSDADHLLDEHMHHTTDSLRGLMTELYELNPKQLTKTPDATIDSRIAEILPDHTYDELRFGELNSHRGVDAISLAFDPRFTGDRVFALMVGLVSQMRVAYNDQLEFFMFDQVRPENLQVFSQNLQIVGMTLKRRVGADGHPLLRYEAPRDSHAQKLLSPTALQILERMVGQLQVLVRFGRAPDTRTQGTATRTATMLLVPFPGP